MGGKKAKEALYRSLRNEINIRNSKSSLLYKVVHPSSHFVCKCPLDAHKFPEEVCHIVKYPGDKTEATFACRSSSPSSYATATLSERRSLPIIWGPGNYKADACAQHSGSDAYSYLAYDNMCNLCRLKVARRPIPPTPPLNCAWLHIKIIDSLHLRNHINPKCHTTFSPQRLKENHPNAQAGEQMFIWMAVSRTLSAQWIRLTTFSICIVWCKRN